VWAKGHVPIPAQPVPGQPGRNHPVEYSHADDRAGGCVRCRGQRIWTAVVWRHGPVLRDSTLIAESHTGDDGTFAFSVAHFGDYTAYRLDAALTRYDSASIPLPGLYSGLPLEQNVTLSYTATGGDLTTSSRITSWAQDERWCKSYGADEDLPLRVKILEKIGSEWCPEYQTTVDWGAFDYDLGLNYTAAGDAHTVSELWIRFSNDEFTSYNVSSGMWNAGGKSRAVTAERIDWVELIAIDGDGNPQSIYAWRDDSAWYSSEQDNPSSAARRLTIDTLAPIGAWRRSASSTRSGICGG